MDICSSPKLFAAYHVFHRLLVPRHPPCALIGLTFCQAWAPSSRLPCLCRMHSVACAFGFGSLNLKELLIKNSCVFVCSVTIKITASDVLLINLSIDRIFLFVCSFQGTNGDGEIRTHDPLLARQVLSQLSYTPMMLAPTCFPIPSPA